jgi:hypothetical protein
MPQIADPEVKKQLARDGNFSMRPFMQIARIVQINIRGTVKVKPEGGTFKIAPDKAEQDLLKGVEWILILRSGVPIALAKFRELKKATMGDWTLEYSDVEPIP